MAFFNEKKKEYYNFEHPTTLLNWGEKLLEAEGKSNGPPLLHRSVSYIPDLEVPDNATAAEKKEIEEAQRAKDQVQEELSVIYVGSRVVHNLIDIARRIESKDSSERELTPEEKDKYLEKGEALINNGNINIIDVYTNNVNLEDLSNKKGFTKR